MLLYIKHLLLILLLFGSNTRGQQSIYKSYESAAVATDARPCAEIGTDVLSRSGTAVDAAVATLLCAGVFNAHSLGVGGGFFMTVYIKETNQAYHLNARETAPAWTSLTMYEENPMDSVFGPKAAAVPGEILGYYEAKTRFGNPDVTWESLLQPTIDMCREGVEVGYTLADALERASEIIKNDSAASTIFVDPSTGEVYQEGDHYYCLALADTLEAVAKLGPQEFYSGNTAYKLIADMEARGGKMTLDDLKNYRVRWEEPVSVDLGDYKLYSNQPPGSGAVLAYMVNILENYAMEPADTEDPVTYQRIAEAFKWGYARRSELGDPFDTYITQDINELVAFMTSEDTAHDVYTSIDDDQTYNDPDHYGAEFSYNEIGGTSHTSILAPNGDAVAITSTINLLFGSGFISPSTGVIMNNEMDDFSFPGRSNAFDLAPSASNFPKPGKRPQSSMAPMILVDSEGNVRLIAGASGGSRITSAIAWTTVHDLWLGMDINQAVDSKRLHHQLMPMELRYETGFKQANLDYLASVGHNLTDNYGLSVVQAVSRKSPGGPIMAAADGRKDGGVNGIDNGGVDTTTKGEGSTNSGRRTDFVGYSIFLACLICHSVLKLNTL